MSRWTYGAELELADWRRDQVPLEPGQGLDLKDHSMVNSCGIAVDPRGELWPEGGEVQTAPSADPGAAGEQLDRIVRLSNRIAVTYRCNLHIHVRVPGLKKDLRALKDVQAFCARWLPKVLPALEPIPEPQRMDYPDKAAWRGARARYARRKVSHHRIMPKEIVERQLAALSCREFFEAEALHVASGKLYWATKPRCAVNLRQMLETDTIEFRHFPGTLRGVDVTLATQWCRRFLEHALDDNRVDMAAMARAWAPLVPQFKPYVHWMEERYRRTSVHYVTRAQAAMAIREIQEEMAQEAACVF
jgi:hypothetical protein